MTSSVRVALKNRVWRFAFGGVLSMIRRTSGMKPMSSIRSASSITRISTLPRWMSPLRCEVQQPSGRGRHHVDGPFLEPALLLLVVHAAEHRQRADIRVLREAPRVLLDLQHELARRGEDQGPRGARGRGVGAGFLAKWFRIVIRNAAVLPVPVCARPGDVGSRKGLRQDAGLDRRAVAEPEVVDRVHHSVGEVQVMEPDLSVLERDVELGRVPGGPAELLFRSPLVRWTRFGGLALGPRSARFLLLFPLALAALATFRSW